MLQVSVIFISADIHSTPEQSPYNVSIFAVYLLAIIVPAGHNSTSWESDR